MKQQFMLLFGLIILTGTILACGESNTGTTANNTGSSTTTNASNKPTQHFKIGDTVNVGSIWQIVVSNVRTVPPGQFDTLKSGDAYTGIDVTFKNISNKEESLYGDADWTLKDTSGQKYNNAYVSDFPNAPEGKVEPGDPAKGSLIFEVPSTTKQFTLAFENNSFTSGQTIWDLSTS
ncbi:MAG TPA: DUF4352 domain-containing protein [Patescibacteria group bacterium]